LHKRWGGRYHQKLPGEHKNLEALLAEVERFAMGDYARALAAGSELSANDRSTVAEKLHQYTGLPVEYILRADLRIDGGEFRQNLRGAEGIATAACRPTSNTGSTSPDTWCMPRTRR
jgi:hypothetical protein